MIITPLENGVTEYVTETAIVRFHPGRLTEEERKLIIVDAAKDFYKAIQKQKAITQITAANPTGHSDQP